ncbi:hypothetical protein FRC06_000939 [Ceratobasidium sp. 370]|nr:hypothetical protein FRC06_000939 [Ceratobasidium sp. 370]
MWQAIKSAVETQNEYEQRKSLVTHNSSESVREAGMSATGEKNLLVALEVLQMLVKTEQRNETLKDKVDTARAVEESLCDRISILEAQLSAKTGETSASSHDLQLLLAQVRAIQTSVQLIKSDTSTIVRHLNTEPPTPLQPLSALQPLSPIQPRTQPQPPTPSTPDAPLDHTRRASTAGRPSILRKPSQNPTNNSPPTPSLRAGPTLNSSPTPTQPSPSNPFRSPKSPSFVVHIPKPTPTPAPTPPRTLTTTIAFSGTSQTELSFAQGQTLHLLPDSDLSPGKDWVWCRTEEGAVGYAPRSYLRVE